MPNGVEYVSAPLYMAGVVAGMVGLVELPRRFSSSSAQLKEPLLSSDDGNQEVKLTQGVSGSLLAFLAGVLSATQFGLVTTGKKMAAEDGTPPEALDALGSWTASFGLGAVGANAIILVALCSAPNAPKLQVRTTFLPASAAGLLYCASLVLTTVAVQLGGNAVIMAQRNATSLVVSGAWGVLWYKEMRGRALAAWCAAALLTVCSVVALGFEKGEAAAGH